MNQCCLFDHDTFIMKLLGIPSIPHASNLSRFIKSFTFKHCQQIIEVKRALMKRFHRIAFHLKHLTLDVDSTVITLCGHQEGAAEGYNDKHRGNPCYHSLLAFIYETKELIHGILKPGNTHCSNGSVEFFKEVTAMLPSGLCTVTVRADSGYFNQELLEYFETMQFTYVIAVKNYTTILRHVRDIPDHAYQPFEGTSDLTVMQYQLDSWTIKRKFIVVRTPRRSIDRQLDLFGIEQYDYQIYVTNLLDVPAHVVHFYRQRGDAENYIKEQKYDIQLDHLMTDSFWANQALMQFKILCYNLLVWFKNIFIGSSERRTTIRTFRERFLLIPGQLIHRSRRLILKLPRDYVYQQKLRTIEMQLA
jgi:hypothetical protein